MLVMIRAWTFRAKIDVFKLHSSGPRREEFLNLFRTFRRVFDDEDGAMEESAFRTLIGQKAVRPFSAEELDDNLAYLYSEGKLMKSDGVLYVID
jgi:hypothetical protein